ncbi:hypothetical protein CGCSCA4_v012857 [Colletotrichum siamense]|uniref:Uncharacterized protein n=1 Tax=Colletotrichum siamense TaxID=690259 RepID=A0A9P5BSD8_COLSI|nr:hypothetical protein CGCSCA4_v012857 [Colletotrichum siamense]KAF4848176.1 hypothetical protein CGCSCA2_v012397 [Colletotrichum siamense]
MFCFLRKRVETELRMDFTPSFRQSRRDHPMSIFDFLPMATTSSSSEPSSQQQWASEHGYIENENRAICKMESVNRDRPPAPDPIERLIRPPPSLARI